MTEDLLRDLVQYKTHKNKSKYYMDMTLNSFFSLCYVVFSYSLCGSAVLIGFYELRQFSVFGLLLSIWSVYPWETKQSRVVVAGGLTKIKQGGRVKKSQP